jgi:hypothetical protein
MTTVAELRRQVESALAGRIPAALSFRPPELQNQENVVSVKARQIHPLSISRAEVRSHDFH